jgi:hypothetical protein
MATPASRLTPAVDNGLELRLPPGLISVTGTGSETSTEATVPEAALAAGALAAGPDLAVEFERVVPASGNLAVRGQQFWLGPDRAGTTVTLWANTTVIHLLIGGHGLKTASSRLSITDLQRLLADGGRPAGPPPLPSSVNVRPGQAYRGPVEVERLVNLVGCISITRRTVPIGAPPAGRRVTLRLDGTVLQIIDRPDGQRVLLRSIAFPLTADQLTGIRGARPAGPPPQPAAELLRVERRRLLPRLHHGRQTEDPRRHPARRPHRGQRGRRRHLHRLGRRPHPARRRPDQPQGGRPIQSPQTRRTQEDRLGEVSPINRDHHVTHQPESDTPWARDVVLRLMLDGLTSVDA